MSGEHNGVVSMGGKIFARVDRPTVRIEDRYAYVQWFREMQKGDQSGSETQYLFPLCWIDHCYLFREDPDHLLVIFVGPESRWPGLGGPMVQNDTTLHIRIMTSHLLHSFHQAPVSSRMVSIVPQIHYAERGRVIVPRFFSDYDAIERETWDEKPQPRKAI